jgi:hypothetical protein
VWRIVRLPPGRTPAGWHRDALSLPVRVRNHSGLHCARGTRFRRSEGNERRCGRDAELDDPAGDIIRHVVGRDAPRHLGDRRRIRRIRRVLEQRAIADRDTVELVADSELGRLQRIGISDQQRRRDRLGRLTTPSRHRGEA